MSSLEKNSKIGDKEKTVKRNFTANNQRTVFFFTWNTAALAVYLKEENSV